jgi:hypothetical protein
MARSAEKFVVYNLRETYHELGRYEFKIVLNPRFFKNSHESSLELVDSSGKPMQYELNRWGRKLNCSFVIDTEVADGVSRGALVLKTDSGQVHAGQISFWVIKP